MFLPKNKCDEARAKVEKLHDAIRAEYSSIEESLNIAFTEQPKRGKKMVMKKSQQKKICLALAGLPYGVIKMSADIPELVETSTNLAVIHTTKQSVVAATSQRSSDG